MGSTATRDTQAGRKRVQDRRETTRHLSRGWTGRHEGGDSEQRLPRLRPTTAAERCQRGASILSRILQGEDGEGPEVSGCRRPLKCKRIRVQQGKRVQD